MYPPRLKFAVWVFSLQGMITLYISESKTADAHMISQVKSRALWINHSLIYFSDTIHLS